MVLLDSQLTLTCCCSRFSSCRRLFNSYRQGNSSNKASVSSNSRATMASLGPRATPTTSRVVVLALGVLLVEAGGDQDHPSQKMNKILRRELKRDNRWSSTPSYAASFFLTV